MSLAAHVIPLIENFLSSKQQEWPHDKSLLENGSRSDITISGSSGERQNSCFESEEEVGGMQANPLHQPVISPFWTQCGTTHHFEATVPMGLVLPEVWLALSDTFPTRVCFLRKMFLIRMIYLTSYS